MDNSTSVRSKNDGLTVSLLTSLAGNASVYLSSMPVNPFSKCFSEVPAFLKYAIDFPLFLLTMSEIVRAVLYLNSVTRNDEKSIVYFENTHF